MRHQLSWQQAVCPTHFKLCLQSTKSTKSHVLKAPFAAASKPLTTVISSQLPAQDLPSVVQHVKAADPIGPSMPASASAALNGDDTVHEAGPQLPTADDAEAQPAPGKVLSKLKGTPAKSPA